MDENQSPPSDNDIINRLMELDEAEETAQPEPPQPEEDADADEVEDSQASDEAEGEEESDESEETEAEFLELQYNGEAERVSKDRATELAQQGLFYERQKAQVEQNWQQAQQAFQAVAMQMNAMPELRAAEAEVALYERALQSIDLGSMQQLAVEDPSQYLSKLAEYNTLSKRLQDAQAKREKTGAQFMEAQQKFQSEMLARERDALVRAVPDWRDSSKFKQAQTRIVNYLTERGYTQQELANLADHRALLVAYDAARYRESQKALKASAKNLGTKPKVVKPGASVTKAQANDEQAKALRQRLKQTGKLEDAAKLFERFS